MPHWHGGQRRFMKNRRKHSKQEVAMRRIAVLALWPFAASADETIEALDGRRFLLKDDGTYERVVSGPCSEPGYMQIDDGYRGAEKAIKALVEVQSSICIIGPLRIIKATRQLNYG